MPALVDALLALISVAVFLFATWSLLPDGAKAQVRSLITNITRGAVTGAEETLADLEPYLHPVVAAFVSAMRKYGPTLLSDIEAPIATLSADIFHEVARELEAIGESTPDAAKSTAAKAMAKAFAFGVGSAGVTAAFEAVFPEKLNTFNAAGPMLAQMAGFEEVSSAIRRPLYDAAFGKSLEYYYRGKFKPELPNEHDAVQWHSRGLIDDAALKNIFDYSGLKREYERPYLLSAYRAVSPFIIARAMESGVLTDAQMRDAMTFYGMRPQDQELMIAAYKDLALQPYRNSALGVARTARERGLLSDAQWNSTLDALDVPQPARGYLNIQTQLAKLVQLDELYRRSLDSAAEYGLLPLEQYKGAIEAIGMDQADVDAHYAIVSNRVRGKELQAEQRALTAEQMRARRTMTAAAEAEYMAGKLGDAAFTAALIGAGWDAVTAGLILAATKARRQGQLRLVYGLYLAPADAEKLKATVARVKEQALKKLLTPEQMRAQLKGLKIPDGIAEELVATWTAQAYKTIV